MYPVRVGTDGWYDQLVEITVVYVLNVFRYYVRSLMERNTYTKYDGYNAVITIRKVQYMGSFGC